MKQQKGFTLIELILVIVILGVLAAVALPRFVNLNDEAETATANGGLGALRSAYTVIYAEQLASGNNVRPTGDELAAGIEPAATCTAGTPATISLVDIAAVYEITPDDCDTTPIASLEGITIQ